LSTSLRVNASIIIEDTLRNSLSWRTAVRDFLCGRALTLLRCIREVQRFETHIKVCMSSFTPAC
jgi:hypothetical protein